MKLSVLFVLVALALLLLAGCWSGPWQLTQSWRDNTQDWYSNNAWVHGALLGDILPVYPIVWLFAMLGDVLIMNPFYFWSHDAWTNEGTAYVHTQPTGPRTVGNLFSSSGSAGKQQEGWAPKAKPKK